MMKYIRTKDDVYETKEDLGDYLVTKKGEIIYPAIIEKTANTIEELCDCFIKIKRKRGYKDYILKHDYRELPLLKEQHIKHKGDSPLYGAIHIEDKGLIYVAKMNEKGELELL